MASYRVALRVRALPEAPPPHIAMCACRDEQRARPLLGDKQELSTLRAEYESGSATFVAKINSLTKQYAQFRRTRQDGNCFYRAFLFGLLEALLTSRNAAGAQKLAAVVSGWKEKLIATGYQELVFEDALDLFLDLLKQVSDTQVRRCAAPHHTPQH